MNRQSRLAVLAVAFALSASTVFAAAKDSASAPEKLTSGRYTATVKAIVCSGCAEFIQATMTKDPAIGAVQVDSKAKQVTFEVKKGATLSVAALQKALKASSDRMGMDADYRLEHIQPAAKG